LFSSLASIVQRTRVFQLQRPDGRETTREVARLVAEATR
jgi:hypothetical protein